MTTISVARIGFEGSLGYGITFKTEYQKDPQKFGSGVWEGIISLSTQESWAKLNKFGASIAAGIVLDSASVDFISDNMWNLFGQDDYIKTAAIQSGLNFGQGVIIAYNFNELFKIPVMVSFNYTSANPLASSTSAPFGGNISINGDLYTVPYRDYTNGRPGSYDTEMRVYGPSLSAKLSIPKIVNVELRAAMQLYEVDIDVTDDKDKPLYGENYKFGLDLRFLDNMFRVFGNYSWRRNDMIEQLGYDFTKYADSDYRSDVTSFGADAKYKSFGVGFNYSVWYRIDNDFKFTNKYLNIAGTYSVMNNASICVRYAKSITMSEGQKVDSQIDDTAWYLTMKISI